MGWIRTNDAAWKLKNESGLKVWLAKGMTRWILHIGDDYSTDLPGFLSIDMAKEVAGRQVVSYLERLICKIRKLK